MKKALLPLFLLALLFTPGTASALDEFNIDVAKITCKELLDMDEDGAGAIILWADGYISAKSGDTRISTDWIAKLGANIGAYCALHPEKNLMDSINAIDQ